MFRSIWEEFKKFAIKGNAVDMAIGIVIGAAFGKIVTSFVNDIIMPPVGLLLGGADFSQLMLTLKAGTVGEPPVTINYGAFINTALDFFIVAGAIFFVVKGMNILKGRKNDEASTSTTKKCPECQMLIPHSAKRCGHCTCTL